MNNINKIKILLFFSCCLPFCWIVYAVLTNNLGANPVEYLSHKTGDWAFNFLLITLSITPLIKFSKIKQLIRFRRILGLFCFFYALLHFLVFVWFDHLFDLNEIWLDVIKRPFISVGFISLVLLLILTITSFSKFIKLLGKNWQKLHRLIYLIAILAALHYLWLVKASALIYPLIYIIILIFLLGFRLVNFVQKLKSK